MNKKLYLVRFVRQDTGSEEDTYVLAESAAVIEDEYADIIKIEPLTPLEQL